MATDAELAAELAARLVEHLDADPAYERHGDLVSDAWGAGQWMRYVDPDGEEHYLRVVVEPHHPN